MRELAHEALFSPAVLKFGAIHWMLWRSAHLMDSRRWKEVPVGIGRFTTTEWTSLGKEIGTDEINWWVFKREKDADELREATERVLTYVDTLKRDAKKLTNYRPDSFGQLLASLRDFADSHAAEAEALNTYVLFLQARDPMAPRILFTYRVWGSTRMSDRSMDDLKNEMPEEPTKKD